jgi:hypothetical protein
MPSATTTPKRRFAPAFAVALAGGLALLPAAPVRGQAPVPEPSVPQANQRSGLISRYIPIQSHLPGDKKRDDWYDTRFGDPPNFRSHPNYYTNGGLYGLRWNTAYTRSFSPFFFGAPGGNTLPNGWKPPRPIWRIGSAWVHPFKPVGMYYDQGTYVPVYDLDPIVPGPGSWPIPFFCSPTHGGG